ncbi:MAG TPA: TlpA disulfide reductase family protein [Burkholderiales bacterium]|jgi:thiol-disulfide isomerase/thioredoxin
MPRLVSRAARALLACAALCLACTAGAGEIKPWKGAAPTLELPDLDGHAHALAEYKGRVVVVNFWATWCEPCRAEMPSMQKMADKYGADKLVVLGVNYQEGAPRIRRFLEANPVHFTVLMDRDGAVTKKWTSRIFPTSVILGPDGRARQIVTGETDWNAPAMDALIAKLLPKQK